MKHRFFSLVLLALLIFTLTSCSNQALENAKIAADTFNAEAAAYNEKITFYNAVILEIEQKNQELDEAVTSAQEVLNKEEQPFDESTTASLKDAMKASLDAKAIVPEKLVPYSMISVDDNAKKKDLESITAQATSDVETIKAFILPELPAVPDYSDVISHLNTAKTTYKDSVQGLKQITTPTDEFVIERLQRIETITAIEAVTEDHDPNGNLNKQGGYIGCIYFSDTNVNRENLYIEDGKDNVIDVGCNGGGAVEIYGTVEDAQKRDAYLAGFDGTIVASGSHYVYGTIVIRTSNELTGTKQQELTNQILQSLLLVIHP